MGSNKKKKDRKGRKKRAKDKKTLASKADIHQLYQDAVQCVEAEIDFVDARFTELRGREARVLREDFGGTANTSCEWVRRRETNEAIAVDLDESVQRWGIEHNIIELGPAADRLEMLNANVLDVETRPVDILLAMNFSYWIFTERALMRRYFERVREVLASDGVFFLDAYGGYDAFREMKERTKNDGFTYIWEQASYNPITGAYKCNIHFKFPDGSRLDNAFVYEWRLWTLPEVREILLEAGFSEVKVFWQSEDEDGEGTEEFFETDEGDADAAWIVYIAAIK